MVTQRHPSQAFSRDTHNSSLVDFGAGSNIGPKPTRREKESFTRDLYSSQMDIEAVTVVDLGQGSVTDGAINPGGLTGDTAITPGTISLTPFADDIRPVAIVGALPALPDPLYPEFSYVVLTTDDRLYKNIGDVWVLGVDGADIVANSITAGQIAAGAIATSELAADAVTADKVAAGAIIASKLDIANSSLGNLIPDSGWEWYSLGVTDYWTLGSQFQIDSSTASLIYKRGRYRLHLEMSAAPGTSTATSSDFIAVTRAPDAYYTYIVEHAIDNYASGAARIRVQQFDDTFASISTTTLATLTADRGLTSSVFRFKEADSATPSGITIDLTLDTNCYYVKLIFDDANAGDSQLDWYITGISLNRGLVAVLDAAPSNWTGSYVHVDSAGIIVREGHFALADEFGSQVMEAAGFSGPWSDFITLGLYNASFQYGQAGVVDSGRTEDLPYWSIDKATGGIPTFQSGGGVRVTFAALNDNVIFTSDAFPVTASSRVALAIQLSVNHAAGDLVVESGIRFFNSAGTLIGSVVPFDIIDVNFGFTNDMWELGTIYVPGTAVTAVLDITVQENTSHSASNWVQLEAVSVRMQPPTNMRAVVGDTPIAYQFDQVVADYVNTAELDVITSANVTGDLTAAAAVSFSNVISPTQLVANTNSWNPTGLSTAYLIRATTDATPRTITGISWSGAGSQDGRVLWLHNANAATSIILGHDVTSTAANRFFCPGAANYTLTAKSSVMLLYSSTDSRWLVLAGGA